MSDRLTLAMSKLVEMTRGIECTSVPIYRECCFVQDYAKILGLDFANMVTECLFKVTHFLK